MRRKERSESGATSARVSNMRDMTHLEGSLTCVAQTRRTKIAYKNIDGKLALDALYTENS